MEETTPKQQVTELLRKAETLVIATALKPNADQIAAAIALTQMLDKLGKRPEAVFSGEAPANLRFLPLNILHKEFNGLRDFIIELDTSKTEADKLKYVPEGKKLKIFITPFNGNFSKQDLDASYGDYHCDGVIMLGAASVHDLDKAVANQQQLLAKTKLISIMPTQSPDTKNEHQINWHDGQASSICEMLMSLTEALQPGLLDNHIATSLLTGIVGATDHFTAANTTPKVMTMAAQLMAAGADQGSIIKHLERPLTVPKTTLPPLTSDEPAKADNELKPSQETSLPHHPMAPAEEFKPHASPTPPIQPPARAPATPAHSTPPPKFAPPPPPPPPLPSLPAQSPPPPPPSTTFTPTPGPGQPPAIPPSPLSPANTPPPTGPMTNPAAQSGVDVEAARRAVEEATRDPNNPNPAS